MRIWKVTFGVTLAVLLVGMSAWTFESSMFNASAVFGQRKTERTLKGYVPDAQGGFTSANGFDSREIKTFQSPLITAYGRLFDRAGWKQLSYADQEYREIVIGIDRARADSENRIDDYVRRNGGRLVDSVQIEDEFLAKVVDVPASRFDYLASEVGTSGLATFLEPNAMYEAYSVPNDPSWRMQWGPAKIEADYAWNTTTGIHSVLVAVVDTGVDWNHPDLAANYVPLGYDWVNLDADPMDDHGHGTHVAGTIAAVLNNGVGIAGLAQVRIMAEKVLDEGGSGSASQVAQGIVHAVDQGADMINLSLGSLYDLTLIHDAVKYAYKNGVLVVAAAGNTGTNVKTYPASYDEVLAVTATDQSDHYAYFTTFGDWVEVGAPGVDIYSTIWDDSYASMSGTSMAAPHAAGVAALIWSEFPNMTRDQVWGQLEYSSDDLGESGVDIYYGFGRINAREAVEQALGNHDALVLSMKIASPARPETTIPIDTVILNMGTNAETDIVTQLLVNDSVVDSASISTLASGKSAHVNFSWNVTAGGWYSVTSRILPLVGEYNVENNFLSKRIEVKNPRILRVPSEYTSIQKAIDTAEEGDTVFVASGVYNENIWINTEALSLIGEEQKNTIIDGNKATDVILVTNNNVRISRLTIRNGRRGLTYAGICAIWANEITISEVTTSENYHGILLMSATHATLRNNTMTRNTYNFGLDGFSPENFIHDVDASNRVDDKPIYYLTNEHNKQIPSDAGYVAVINSTNVFVKDLDLNEKNFDGVLFAYSANCSIQNVNVTSNYFGIRLYQSGDNNISGNIANGNQLGIYLSYSGNNFLRDNRMIVNTYNFGIDGDSIPYFGQEIDTSNTVDAKPIYYLVNENGRKVPADAGYVAAVNSTNITLENLNIANNWQGVLFASTSQSQITNVTLSDNCDGIYLWHSDYNVMQDNHMSSSTYREIGLQDSRNNTIVNNTITEAHLGVDLERSNKNVILGNKATDSTVGVEIGGSSSNAICGNTMSGCAIGIELWYSSDNVVADNEAFGGTLSQAGIKLSGAQRNIIKGNEVTYNYFIIGAGIYLDRGSKSNIIIQNTATYNWYGIRIGYVGTSHIWEQNNNNTIHHNNFIQSFMMHVYSINSINTWDDGFPSGGNYWEGYGQDSHSGPNQNLTGSDGISDAPFVIDRQNRDRYPYMKQIRGPRITGDLNHDSKVDIVDLALAATTFGTYAGHPRWNPLTDVNNDGKSDIKDLVLIAKNFGKTSQ